MRQGSAFGRFLRHNTNLCWRISSLHGDLIFDVGSIDLDDESAQTFETPVFFEQPTAVGDYDLSAHVATLGQNTYPSPAH